MSRIRVWRGIGELRENSADLEAALAATGAEVSASWPAIGVWLEHHPEEQPWAVLIEGDTRSQDDGGRSQDGGRWRAVVVLSVRQRRGIGYVRSATESGTVAALTARDESAALALADAVSDELSARHRPWVMRLGLLPEQNLAAGALRQRLRHTQFVPGQVVPRLRFAPGSDVRSYLSRNTRSSVARACNRLLRITGEQPQLSWLTSPAQARSVLPEVLDVHRRRNLELRDHAALDDPEATRYFEDMVIRHAERGRLQLLTARVNGVLAAFAVCFSADSYSADSLGADSFGGGSTCWVYANLVAPQWTDFSLGTVANAEVVRHFHAQPGTGSLDWGAGSQRYKLSGGAEVASTQVLQSWSSWPLRVGTQLRRLQPVGATS